MSIKKIFLCSSGGGIGAAIRYLLSLIFTWETFPWLTLLVNFLGSVLIGYISGKALQNTLFPPHLILFLQTGLCGGFTTFSTFSLEMFTLLENNRYTQALIYGCLSVFLCLGGVILGRISSCP